MDFRSTLLGGLIAFAAAPALAQGNSAINRLGTVDNVDASSISLKSDQGSQDEVFKLAPNVLVLQTRPANLADIKPNDFVASAARIGTDGKLHSTEVRIFPDAMRGVGEGQRPMNDAAKQTMTNATVTGAAVVSGSNDLTVKFAGESQNSSSIRVFRSRASTSPVKTWSKAVSKCGCKAYHSRRYEHQSHHAAIRPRDGTCPCPVSRHRRVAYSRSPAASASSIARSRSAQDGNTRPRGRGLSHLTYRPSSSWLLQGAE